MNIRKRIKVSPSIAYGKRQKKMLPLENHQILYFSNFAFYKFFYIRKKAKEYIETGKGYVLFDIAYDIGGEWLPFDLSITVYIKDELMTTAFERYKEYQTWMNNLLERGD